MIDTDNSGQITFEELKAGLARVGAHIDEPEVKALMEAVIFLSVFKHKLENIGVIF